MSDNERLPQKGPLHICDPDGPCRGRMSHDDLARECGAPTSSGVYVVHLDEYCYGETYARVMGAFSTEERARAFIDAYAGTWSKSNMSIEKMFIDEPPGDD